MAESTGAQDSGAKEQAQEKAQEVAGQAQEKAQQAAGQAKGRMREQVDQRSTQAGERVNETAGDIRTVGEELRKQGKEQPAKVADQLAERGEKLGGYLRDSDADRILGDVEDFGRSQPWAVMLGGLALGFAASRFLKASSESRYEQSRRRVSGDLSDGTFASDRDLVTAGTPVAGDVGAAAPPTAAPPAAPAGVAGQPRP